MKLFRFALSSSLTCPHKKTPFRVELDLYFIAGKRMIQEKGTASSLGFEGASLVDLDGLLSSKTIPKQRTLANTFTVQTQAIGKERSNASVWMNNAIFGEGFMWNCLVCA